MELLTDRRDGNHFLFIHSEKQSRDVYAGEILCFNLRILFLLCHCSLFFLSSFTYIDESEALWMWQI